VAKISGFKSHVANSYYVRGVNPGNFGLCEPDRDLSLRYLLSETAPAPIQGELLHFPNPPIKTSSPSYRALLMISNSNSNTCGDFREAEREYP